MSARHPDGFAGEPGLLSIVIKALNEEAKIARAIESALAARAEVAPLRLEVVVADSCSTDRTVEIASRYPIRVVQFARPADRGCGAGVQLGYAWARGEWVYLMDGDMALSPGFLSLALRTLKADPSLAGVGGSVVDERIANDVDRIRVNNRAGATAGDSAWLVGGGLYRREAIAKAGGYAADRNLKGYEEAELGLRLRSAGYRLRRLPECAVKHVGHSLGTWELLKRHWRSRRAMSAGVLLRSSLGRPWFAKALRLNVHPIVTAAWWLALPLLLLGLPEGQRAGGGLAWLAATVLALGAHAALKRDLRHTLASVMSWHYAAAAIALGAFERRVDPHEPIDAVVLHDGAAAQQ